MISFGEARRELWKHMAENHDVILLESEMDDLERVVAGVIAARCVERSDECGRLNIQRTVLGLLKQIECVSPRMVHEMYHRISDRQALNALMSLRMAGLAMKLDGVAMDSVWVSRETWEAKFAK